LIILSGYENKWQRLHVLAYNMKRAMANRVDMSPTVRRPR